MLLKDFENALKNIENDKMIMSYGNNQSVVSGVLSVVSLVDQVSSLVRADRINDMFSYNMANKVSELEQMVINLGMQRLMNSGINVTGIVQGINPYMGQSGMGMYGGGYNPMMFNPMQQPMYNGIMPESAPQGYAPMQGFAQMTPPPPPQGYVPMPQPQQGYAAPQPAQSQPAPAPVQPRPAPAPQKPVGESAPQGGGGSMAMGGALPGMGGGGDEKAAGRDYLLKLLNDNGAG